MTLVHVIRLPASYISNVCRQRPYHVESTGSRPITEVKQRRARLVLEWVTAWEPRVLLASTFFFLSFLPFFFFFFLGWSPMFRRRFKQHDHVIFY